MASLSPVALQTECAFNFSSPLPPLLDKMCLSTKPSYLMKVYGKALTPKGVEALKTVDLCFQHKRFKKPEDKHALHSAVTTVTEELRQCSPSQKTWRAFLNTKPTFVYPNGRSTRLDFSRDLARLDGRVPSLVTEDICNDLKCKAIDPLFNLDPYKSLSPKIFQQIVDILNDSFEFTDQTPIEFLGEKLDQNCIIVKDKQAGQVLGTLFFYITFKDFDTPSGIYIEGLCRKADAACLGVGSKLLERLFEIIDADPNLNGLDVMLNVDKDNEAACRLYENHGFCRSSEPGPISQDRLEPGNVLYVYRRNQSAQQAAS